MRKRKLAALAGSVMLALLLMAGCGENAAEVQPQETETPQSAVTEVSPTDAQPALNLLGGRELSPEAQALCGSWAYSYEPETPVLVLGPDGGAIYNGNLYTFDCDDQFIELNAFNGETTRVRYMRDGDDIYIYRKSVYRYTGEGEPNGLVGSWRCDSQRWTYIFNENGTFVEDEVFPGYYTVDEEKSTFTLIYMDHFENTECIFKIDGNELFLEYPWRLVKTK